MFVIKGGCLVVVCYLVCVCNLLLFDVFGDDFVDIVFGFMVFDVIMLVDVFDIFCCYDIVVFFEVCDVFVL